MEIIITRISRKISLQFTEEEQGYTSTLSLTSALDEVDGQRHAPVALPPGKETRYTLCRRLDGPHDRSRRVRKISPLPGFDLHIVPSVAGRYTDWAIPARVIVRIYSQYLPNTIKWLVSAMETQCVFCEGWTEF
jgi:hypothetical protein